MPPLMSRTSHISKDEAKRAVAALFPMVHDGTRWSEPTLPRSPMQQTDNLFFWRVNTSLFFGLMPSKMGASATYNNMKQRHEILHDVRNPAEQGRTQTSAFREGQFIGIVLRGNRSYGWASSAADTSDFPSALMCFSTDQLAARPGQLLQSLAKLALELMGQRDDPRAVFDEAHWAQLDSIAIGTWAGDCAGVRGDRQRRPDHRVLPVRAGLRRRCMACSADV